MLQENTTILFQGDSITDGARGRSQDLNHIMGHGYAYLIAAQLGAEQPQDRLHFINRGCSGNRIVDLYARWQEDAINLQPDVISILVGINDVGAAFSNNAGVSAQRFEKVYRLILEESRAALPRVNFVLCDPFVLPVGERKARWPEWKSEVDRRIEIVRRLADEWQTVHVASQELFDNACRSAPPEYWLWDGVHPMPAGHHLLAQAWLKAVKEQL